MGKVLWRETSISTNIFWFRISVKPLREVRGWYMIISSHLESMQVDVDNYLTRAEEKNDISCLVKANAFRKTVREKEDSVKELEKAIGKLEYELRNLK